jgi:hypothetical protein
VLTLAFPRLDYLASRLVPVPADWDTRRRKLPCLVRVSRTSDIHRAPGLLPPRHDRQDRPSCSAQRHVLSCVGRRHAAWLLRCHRRRRRHQQRAQPQQRRKRLKRRWAQRQPRPSASTNTRAAHWALSACDSPVFSTVCVLPCSSLLPPLPSLQKLTYACMQRISGR